MLNTIISVWSTLDSWDKSLFRLINGRLTNSVFDVIAPMLRNQSTWYPIYIALIIFIIYKLKKESWKWIAGMIVSVSVSDIISSHILKNLFGRTRPCCDISMIGHCRLLLDHCPANPSFTSSHASNHFSMGVFMFLSLHRYFGKWSAIFLLWAAVIAYSQVYVGVHYPLDVIGGGFLGTCIGMFVYKLYCRIF